MKRDWNHIPNELVEDLPPGWPAGWCSEELGEPILVLATRLNRKPRPTPPWHVIQHQTAGNACHQHRMWALRLSSRPEIQEAMIQLEKRWYESNVGWWPDLDQIIAYRHSLLEIFGSGFDCKRSFAQFEEAIYPIDCSKELLERICTDKLPDSFDEFFDDELSSLIPYHDFDRAELYVLGANSD